MKAAQLFVALSIAGLSAGAFAQSFQVFRESDAGQPQRIDNNSWNGSRASRDAARRELDQRNADAALAQARKDAELAQRNRIGVRAGPVELVVGRAPLILQRVEIIPVYVIQEVRTGQESSHS